jgi:N6-L-threonylcarbamoyladenine synthase
VLVTKTFRAVAQCGVRDVAVVGGVAANRRLRQKLEEEAAYHRIDLHLPELRHCTDNAVMIAAGGYAVWRRAGFCRNPLELDAVSRWL